VTFLVLVAWCSWSIRRLLLVDYSSNQCRPPETLSTRMKTLWTANITMSDHNNQRHVVELRSIHDQREHRLKYVASTFIWFWWKMYTVVAFLWMVPLMFLHVSSHVGKTSQVTFDDLDNEDKLIHSHQTRVLQRRLYYIGLHWSVRTFRCCRWKNVDANDCDEKYLLRSRMHGMKPWSHKCIFFWSSNSIVGS
jgi:hypothetical protein